MQNRRQFAQAAALGTGALLLTRCAVLGHSRADDAWDAVPHILARIRPPVFPDRDFLITTYGAVGDGVADCTAAFQSAIEACGAAGGGRVVVPSGRFQTGPIHLRSNINLYLERGATVAFQRDPSRYLPAVFTRWEGVEVMNYSPFIYAFEQQNIAISGQGTLDGQADNQHWWPWNGKPAYGWKQGDPNQIQGRKRLFDMAERGVPVADRVFGTGDYLRPNFIQPYRCVNVMIEGVSIVNSPMWEIHPVLCRNVIARNVKVVTHGPNNDGCNPESCQDVLIEGCEFDTGDDCIAIKSGRNADGRRLNMPTENVIVRNCRMKDGHGGVTLGSEISGGVRNVFAERCVMDSPNLDRALRFKNNAMRGGLLENVYMRDVEVGQVADAVLSIDFHYEEGANGPFKPLVRNVHMQNVTSKKSKYALYLRGLPNAPIYDISIENCTFDNVDQANVIEHVVDLDLDAVRIERA
jgi:polygalacturonase